MNEFLDKAIIGISVMFIWFLIFVFITYFCAFANYDQCCFGSCSGRRSGKTGKKLAKGEEEPAQVLVRFNPGFALERAWNLDIAEL